MTTTQPTPKSKLPAPVYAAAGAGDFAYQQLRKLPAKVAELRERVAANEVDLKVDVDRLRKDVEKLRKAAVHNAKVVADATREATKDAQDRAVALYTDLVSRGEHVVAGTRPPLKVKATVEVAPAPEVEPTAAAEPKAPAKKATRPAAPRK